MLFKPTIYLIIIINSIGKCGLLQKYFIPVIIKEIKVKTLKMKLPMSIKK
jgi:hypothetical protein